MRKSGLLPVVLLSIFLVQWLPHYSLLAAPLADTCITSIEAQKMTPEPPVCGQPTRITVHITDTCGVSTVYLGFQGPPPYDWGWFVGSIPRSGGTRYDGYWTHTIAPFLTGGVLRYGITVRRTDGTEVGPQYFLTQVVPCCSLTEVVIDPPLVTLNPGESQQFAAKGLDCNGVEIPDLPFTWSVTQGGGTITPSGLFTAGTTLNIFVETVRAQTPHRALVLVGNEWWWTDTTMAGLATVTVACTLKRVEVYPANPIVPAGRSQQFSAKGFDCNDKEITSLDLQWSVVNGGGTISDTGLFTAGVAEGDFANTIKVEATHAGGAKTGFTGVTVWPACPGPAPQPATYSGSVVTGFGAAPDGTTVVARVDGRTLASATTSKGTYANLVVAPPCSTQVGKEIEFSVDGQRANETNVFQPGTAPTLDLTVGKDATILLSAGWNLISFPTPQQQSNIAAVFADVPAATMVYTLDSEKWLHAVRSPNGWVGPLTQIADGKGYWVLAKQAASVRLRPMYVLPLVPSAYDDEFQRVTLDPKWSWTNEDATHWSLSANPGYMRIVTQIGDLPQRETGPAHNLLLQSPPTGDFEMVTKVDFAPGANYQQAGLIAYESDAVSARLVRSFVNGGQVISFTTSMRGWSDFASSNTPFTGTTAHLKIRRTGTTWEGYFSSDGTTWTLLAARGVTELDNYKIGVAAFNGWPADAPESIADFDYFRVIPATSTTNAATPTPAGSATMPTPPPIYPLSAGWNLVGYTSLSGKHGLPVAAYLRGLDWTVVYRHSLAGGYEDAKPGGIGFTDIEVGRGYYIYLTSAGRLVVP
ncbi:MAG: DUF1349 domain-containing protein [Chloroflexota bacterium]